jgi:cytoskeletal protein CcmA (bactofilin family)
MHQLQGDAMFNRDALIDKKDETQRNALRNVNVTPDLGGTPARHSLPQTDATKKPAGADETPGSKLIVGPDIKMKGVEITNCDTLVVEGRLEASMDSRVVQIAENGVFTGTVAMDVAEIFGRFDGELTARKQLVIHATGRVSGHIRYGNIRIEEGGELTGDVSTIAGAKSAATK